MDRLDSCKKISEGKRNLWRGSIHASSIARAKEEYMPMDVAIEEVHSKGSLMDRIAALEKRLFQLCLEIESSRSSCVQRDHKSMEASSSIGSETEGVCSYPTFNNPNPRTKRRPQVDVNKLKFEKESQRSQQKLKIPASNRDRNPSKMGKKGITPSWPHLKILGC